VSYHWNWQVFYDPVAVGSGQYLHWLLSGAGVTLAIGLTAWLLALLVGVPVGALQTARSRGLRLPAVMYSELFRNVPLIVQMFIWYFVIPELLPAAAARWIKREMPLPEATTAVVALGLYTASRVAIQVRAGIDGISAGLRDAARALGLNAWDTYRRVLLPLALRTMVPVLTSEFMSIMKNTSIALTIGLMELTARARAMNEYTFQGFETFTAATILYVLIALSANRVMRRVELRCRIPGMAADGSGRI
jgi:glutamate/aspartate transport system permease protein